MRAEAFGQGKWRRLPALAAARMMDRVRQRQRLAIMPTVLRIGPYRFFFYANESGEPRHIHVQRERMLAKFWLRPVALAGSTGFPAQELHKLLGMVETHQAALVEAWDEFFGI